MTVAMTLTSPALPSSMSTEMIWRRTGWVTTVSDSLVVKPTVLKAERAWNFAISRESPVNVSITAAMRLIISEISTMTNKPRIGPKAVTPWRGLSCFRRARQLCQGCTVRSSALSGIPAPALRLHMEPFTGYRESAGACTAGSLANPNRKG